MTTLSSAPAFATRRTPIRESNPSACEAPADTQQVIEENADKLYRFALSLAKNDPDARDLTQHTFMQLLRKGYQIQDTRKVSSWLFTTLYRQFLATVRRRKRYTEVQFEASSEALLPHTPSRAARSHDGAAAMAALQQLDERYRAPLALFYLQDQSYREISSILGLPIGTVMSRISRAKQKLRELLDVETPANQFATT